MKKLFGLLLVSSFALALNASQTITQNGTGYDGLWWSFWNNFARGSVTMTLNGGGNYAVSWSNCGDFTCGKGWSTGGYRTVGYNCGYYSNSGGGSLALYGWTTGPLIEYYVNEKWGSSRPSATYVGYVSSDGGGYDVYKHQQVNQPSIQGTATFWQYFSTRQGQQGSGNHSITTGNHFNYWKAHIGSMGSFNVMDMSTEGWGGSGYCNVTAW